MDTERGQKLKQLQTMVTFLKDSLLHAFLSSKQPDMIKSDERSYPLYVVMGALRHVISRERLYDPNNTAIIICSTDLEIALDMKFLHVYEAKDVVLRQMEKLPGNLLMPPPTQVPTKQAPKKSTLL